MKNIAKLALTLMAIVITAMPVKAQTTGSDTYSGNRNVFKISVTSIIAKAPVISYERAFTGRGSMEVGAGYFFGEEYTHDPSGFQLKFGVKYNIGSGDSQRAKCAAGYLAHGFYVKPELCYVHRSLTEPTYASNNGWDVAYTDYTVSDNTFALMLVAGYQLAWSHFYMDFYAGFGRYYSTNAFRDSWYYGFLGSTSRTSQCFSAGVKVGLPF